MPGVRAERWREEHGAFGYRPRTHHKTTPKMYETVARFSGREYPVNTASLTGRG